MIAPADSLSRDSVVWICATLGLAMSPHWLHLAPWISVFCLTCVGWRLAMTFGRVPAIGAIVRVALTALAVFGTLAQYGTVFGRQAGVTLLLLMLSLKLLEMRTPRDVFVVGSLSFFVIATQFLFSQNPLLALYSLGVIVCITTALMVLQDPDASIARPKLARQAGALLWQAVPLMCVLFLLFPRLASPLWGVPLLEEAKTGLSDEMSPGSIAALYIDDSVAFRVHFPDGVPDRSRLYWRGPVLWRYDGETWTRHGVPRHSPRLANITKTSTYRITLEPHNRHWLFALDVPLAAPEGAVRTGAFELLSRQEVGEPRTYLMRSALVSTPTPALPRFARRAALQLPEGYNPATRALGQKWARRAGGPREVVQRALEFFQQQPFYYTLTPAPVGRNAMDDFLFNTREGYCEHYASAFTLLMRAAGVPARVVTGYLGGYFNPIGEYLVVRQSDAHAWSEVWLRGEGWVRIDPTAALPRERIDVAGFGASSAGDALVRWSWFDMMYMSWDAVQNVWNRWLLTYDYDKQQSLLHSLSDSHSSWRDHARLLGAGAFLALAAGLAAALWRRKPHTRDPAVRAWNQFKQKLRRAGMDVEASETPTSLGRRAGQRWPARAADIARICRNYVAVRYHRRPPPGALVQLQQECRALRLPRIRRN